MSKKTKKSKKKNQLTKKEIDAMVQEVLEEAAREAAMKAPAKEPRQSVGESEPASKRMPEAAVSPKEKSTEPEASSSERSVASEIKTVKPKSEKSKPAKPKSGKAKSAKSKTQKPAVPFEAAKIKAKSSADNPAAAEHEVLAEAEVHVTAAPENPAAAEYETARPAFSDSVGSTGINDFDSALPRVPEDLPEPTGSRSVFLTVREDGKLAIAANRDGEIIYEDNAIPSKPAFFFRFKKYIIAVAAIAVMVGAWFVYDYLIPKNVTVIIHSLEDCRQLNATVPCHSVADALDKMGIKLSDIDEVHPFLTCRAKSGVEINVTRRLEALATIEGKKQRFIKIPGTVGENLAFNEIEYDEDDIVSPLPEDNMTAAASISVEDVVIVVKEEERAIPSGSKVILDPGLASGVYSATDAQEGSALYTHTTTYINGKNTGTVEEFKKWITKPQDDTIKLGTSITGQSGEVEIIRSFVSNTTAYYMGEDAYGASGAHCHYGTCAVDPSVIPYGSILWVSGYGFAVANDCGGAIVGTNLDLYMSSSEECYSWGRRYVTAYLLSWA